MKKEMKLIAAVAAAALLAGCDPESVRSPDGTVAAVVGVDNGRLSYGVALDGATVYVTTRPCTTCLKALVTSGVGRIIFDDEYPDELSCRLAREAGVELIPFRDLVSAAPESEPETETDKG